MKGKYVLITFAFFLEDLCQKAGHWCRYSGQTEVKQISVPRFALPFLFCLALKKKIKPKKLNLTSDAQPFFVHPDMMHPTCENMAPAVLWFGLYKAGLNCGLLPAHLQSRCFIFWYFTVSEEK